MMKLSALALRSGLIMNLLMLLSLFSDAQITFSKSFFLNKDNLNQVLGLSINDPITAFGVSQDATGLNVTFLTQNNAFSYGYSNNLWRNHLSRSLVYDTGIHSTNPYLIWDGGRESLIGADLINQGDFFNLYVSDGLTARSVTRNADWGSLNPQTFSGAALSFNNGNTTLVGTSNIQNYDYYLLHKQGNEPLKALNSSPLHDPRGNRYIEQINVVFPTLHGFALQAVSAEGTTVYEYRNGGLVPLFDDDMNYFGDGEVSLFGSIRPSVNPQDGILFQYCSNMRDENGYGLYQNGVFSKVAYNGQTLPNGAGKIMRVLDGWLDNGDVIFSAVLEHPDPTLEETALLYYHYGELSLIDRFIYGGQHSRQIYLNGFVNGSFLVSIPDFYSNDFPAPAQVYRYTLVPEPGTFVLLAVSVLSGIYLRRRSRRLAVSLREIQC